jgi:hypothetical protein
MKKAAHQFMSVILLLAFTFGSYNTADALSMNGNKEINPGISALQTSVTRMLIPLYSDPSTQWTSVVNANVYKNIDVILNPSNGPGAAKQTSYVNGIAQLRSAGVGILGYVYTGYGTRSLTTVKAEVDNWKNWYGVDGIFFDEADNTLTSVSYYSNLQTYVNARAMTSTLNPGTNTLEAYMPAANTNVIYENDPSNILSVSPWASNYPASKFGALQYAASAAQMRTFVANVKAKNIGYVFVTDDVLNNPWDKLPAYLAEEAALLAGGSTVTSTPASVSTTPAGIISTVTSTFTSTPLTSSAIPLSGVSAANPCIGAPAPASWKVVVFVLENRTRTQVIGNANAPYITSLANKCGSSVVWNDADKKVNGTNDSSGGYDSKPNYSVFTNGQSPSATGITDDTYATKTTAYSIYDQMLAKGTSFKDYYGSTTAGGCSVSWNGDYHDPIRYYSSITSAICNAHDVPISQFMTDVNSGSLPSFSIILPNSSDSMHDNTTASGDTYTKNFLEPFLNSAEYASGHVALFLMFDEDAPVPNVLIAPSIATGSLYQPVAGNNPVSHFSALRTWEEMLGLPLIGDTEQAPSLLAFYGGTSKVVPTNTPVNTPTKTSTPIAPTITLTAQASNTITPTVKPTNTIVPSATATSTAAAQPSFTPSATMTRTPTAAIQPSFTPLATATFAPTATWTAIPSLTATNPPTITPTSPPTSIPSTASPTNTAAIPSPVPAFTSTASPTTVAAGSNIIDVRVTRGKDDAEESAAGKMSLNSSNLELVYDGNNQIVGIRFSNINIPKGAVITKAYLQFTAGGTSSNAATLSIQGEAKPNAAPFSAKKRNVSSRTRTINSVAWSPAAWLQLKANGPDQRTPNLAPIVQEIVNQQGWAAGNSLVMIITGTGKRVAEAYEADHAGAPLLHIEYSIPAASANTLVLTPTLLPTASIIASPTIVSPTQTALPPAPTNGSADTVLPTEIIPAETSTPVAP